MRQIDRILKYAGADRRVKKVVDWAGVDYVWWQTEPTIAEKKVATKNAGNDETLDFALHLMCLKCENEDGSKQYNPASDVPILKQRASAALIDQIVLAIIAEPEAAEGEALDMKSTDEGPRKGKRAIS